MPLYSYRARSIETGRLVLGTEEGLNPDSVARRLEDKGLVPIKISPKTLTSINFFSKDFTLPFIGLPKIRDLVVFTRQLSAMLGAGVTLITSLRSLEKQTYNKNLKNAIKKIELDIRGGSSLSTALKKFPRIFPEYYSEMIYAGEISGTLKEVLDRLAMFLENEEITRSRISMATRYPLMVIIVMLVAFIFLIYFVIPKFTAIFSQLRQDLPLPTRILIFVANFSQKYWYFFFFMLVVIISSYRTYSLTEQGKEVIDSLKIRVPVFGPLLEKIIISRMAQLLGMMVKSGVSINQSLQVISRALGNKVFERTLKNVHEGIVSGYPMSIPLSKSPLFPPIVVQMIAVGEESGELELMMEQIVNYYQLEIEYTIKNFMAMLEPILIVMLTVIVLIMALGIFMPMWNLIEMYSKGAL